MVNFIFLVAGLPDTMSSWAQVVQLHVWMLMARLMVEGDEGKCIRNALVKAMWNDTEEKVQKVSVCVLFNKIVLI